MWATSYSQVSPRCSLSARGPAAAVVPLARSSATAAASSQTGTELAASWACFPAAAAGTSSSLVAAGSSKFN